MDLKPGNLTASSDINDPAFLDSMASEIESEDRSPVSLRSTVELLAAAHSVIPELGEARTQASSSETPRRSSNSRASMSSSSTRRAR